MISDLLRGGGVIRTIEQIQKMIGYASRSGAKAFLQRLVKDGYLEQDGKDYRASSLLVGLPLFESVRAGLPFTPGQEVSTLIQIDKFMIEHPNSTFLVKVKGDSMRDAGIIEGDIAVVDKSMDPKNGDTVIVSIGGDVTIKHYQKSGGRITLIPANPNYHPIVIDEDAEILGVVSGMIRKYR